MTEALNSGRLGVGLCPCVMKPGTLCVLFCFRCPTPSPSALMSAGSSSSHAPRLGDCGS